MELISIALTVAMLLIIWFKTNAFVEYMDLVYLSKFFSPLKNFALTLDDTPDQLFVSFLGEHYKGYIIRLLTCPICTSVWLSLLFCAAFSSISCILPASFLSLLFYSSLVRLL